MTTPTSPYAVPAVFACDVCGDVLTHEKVVGMQRLRGSVLRLCPRRGCIGYLFQLRESELVTFGVGPAPDDGRDPGADPRGQTGGLRLRSGRWPVTAATHPPLRLAEDPPRLSATEDLARAIARFVAESAAADPWAKYPPVLTTEHVAEILGITASSVSEACRRGSLPMRKLLGRYVIDQVAFRALVAAGAA